MAQLTVQIVTPDGLVYDHHASFVSVRTLDGEMGILPRHENMIAVLAQLLLTLQNVLVISTLVVQNVPNFEQSVKLKKHKTNT